MGQFVRVVILSDIHGSFNALDAVSRELPDTEAVYVAGDLCLDGPHPERVIQFVRERGWRAVRGNTDVDVVEASDSFAGIEADTVAWTRARIGPDGIKWLAALPFSLQILGDDRPAAQVVHANPLNLGDHLYPDMHADALEPYLAPVEAPLLAFGHLHIPYIRPVAGRLLVDVASVGHPKDGDRRAAFTVIEWDGEIRRVTQVRVPYDIEAAVRALRESDLPGADEKIHSLLRASY